MTVLRELLSDCIDYAGLFPPARLSMADAVAAYAGYLNGPDRKLLGRFILPATRLDEFASAAETQLPRGDQSLWRLSVLAGHDCEAEREAILEFNASHSLTSPRGHALCDTVEAITRDPAEIDHIVECFRDSFRLFIEVPVNNAPSMIRSIGAEKVGAKIRTGGITRDAFPAPDKVAAFLVECHRSNVPFKATAGLHHPLRAEFALTYESGAERAPMFGYLNLFIAAAEILRGDSSSATDALMESDSSAIQADDHRLAWRDRGYDATELRRLRDFFLSFGSCSFAEPITEARELGLLK